MALLQGQISAPSNTSATDGANYPWLCGKQAEGIVAQLHGKYYTNASKEILHLLKSAGSNAEFKGLEAERLIVNASAHRGFRFYRPRRFKMIRQRIRSTNVQLILQER